MPRRCQARPYRNLRYRAGSIPSPESKREGNAENDDSAEHGDGRDYRVHHRQREFLSRRGTPRRPQSAAT